MNTCASESSLGLSGQNTLFVCVDMQNLFLDPGDWQCPGAMGIIPNCLALSEAAADRALFTRFVPAWAVDDAQGAWKSFYQRWASVTGSQAGLDQIEVVTTLRHLAVPERTFDKATYGAFESAAFASYIRQKSPDNLVLYGIETDVCILATALKAVDLGIRVMLPRDALASSDTTSHQMCLDHVYPRLDQQIDITDTQTLLAEWSRS
ncbi:isochorismatase family cysteine hydrolase [Ruegeria hyattellae]|uniref:isochorismatase family cysteine hydrolase n=1 Tax=Ruegeria hyattellae TaxID=3233337 RepID=UPI00355B0A4F